ncbi:carbohydrate esterase family 5 protein [Macroventuria anomochaeta]|uniref:Carbohydrate esterase family 5 protein n=1 Tax=Macroventuria anomochaeta TaxID=301207 RepID=A0ACB6RQI8_9PLEO|nr:carbohydrate esterase family 5 protein [Macroventuria anomochaeta]KAF2624225.1 carbohydrate esterase family 5 protein [Macroventuria anomochaeta]
MYFQSSMLITALAGLAAASPLETRQFGLGGTGSTSNEFSQGGCRDILFAWARGSTEIGNMGTVVGPPTSDGLKQEFGDNAVATEGIDYAATIGTNAIPGGTDTASKRLMQDTLNSMAQKCPDSVIVAGGYSQGAAVNHRAIEELDARVQDQIAGVVLYGDTQKQQDNNQIPNFPADKVKIICQTGDAVCRGQLVVLPAHLTYGSRADEGVEFLVQQVKGAQAKIKARDAKRDAEKSAVGLAATVKKVAIALVA